MFKRARKVFKKIKNVLEEMAKAEQARFDSMTPEQQEQDLQIRQNQQLFQQF